MVRGKVQNESVATFLDVYDVFASKFCHFAHLGMYLKVIQLLKAKKVTFRDKSSQQVENDQNLLHLAFVLGVEMKTGF